MDSNFLAYLEEKTEEMKNVRTFDQMAKFLNDWRADFVQWREDEKFPEQNDAIPCDEELTFGESLIKMHMASLDSFKDLLKIEKNTSEDKIVKMAKSCVENFEKERLFCREAEVKVIGTILKTGDFTFISKIVESSDFSDEFFGMYEDLLGLFHPNIDNLVELHRLKTGEEPTDSFFEYINEIYKEGFDKSQVTRVMAYCDIVKERSILRQLQRTAKEIIKEQKEKPTLKPLPNKVLQKKANDYPETYYYQESADGHKFWDGYIHDNCLLLKILHQNPFS